MWPSGDSGTWWRALILAPWLAFGSPGCQPKDATPPESTVPEGDADADADTDTDTDADSDTAVARVGDWVDLAVGFDFVCGIKDDQSLLCWGRNDNGESKPPWGRFVDVEAAPDGLFACALTPSGRIHCWGLNNVGQTDAPAGVFTDLFVGGNASCAARIDGRLICWGFSGGDVGAPPGGPIDSVSFPLSTACGLRPNGRIVCWGADTYETDTDQPPRGSFIALDCGQAQCFALDEDGRLNDWGQGPDPRWDVLPPEDAGYVGVVNATYLGCATRPDRTTSCWGMTRSVPPPDPSDRILMMGVGDFFACFLHQDGRITCSGTDRYCDCFDIPD